MVGVQAKPRPLKVTTFVLALYLKTYDTQELLLSNFDMLPIFYT